MASRPEGPNAVTRADNSLYMRPLYKEVSESRRAAIPLGLAADRASLRLMSDR